MLSLVCFFMNDSLERRPNLFIKELAGSFLNTKTTISVIPFHYIRALIIIMALNMDNKSKNETGLLVEVNNNCNCIVEIMVKRKFASLPLNEKEIIVKSPKPTPILNIQSKTKTYTRYFNKEIYEKFDWICGCAHLSKLFCWPCILFSHELNTWSKYGYSDLNNLSKARKRHECSQSHICSTVQFIKFGKVTRTEEFLTGQLKANIEIHNREVTANRYILSKFISAICFLTKQGQPLQGLFEQHESENRGNCVELLYLLSESDIKLKTYLDNSPVFIGIAHRIQNDLVPAISIVLLDEIKSEIRASKFVSIIVEESTDIGRKAQLSTVFRYVDKNNETQERFVGFVDVSPDRTADALFLHIRTTLEQFECLDKLIAQTYDGAAVMSGEHNEVQRKIQDVCPNSLFVHCYAHRLNLVLLQSVNHIAGCKRFFKNVLSFSSFFCNSSRRVFLLDCEIKKQNPTAAPTRWNYNSRILNMVLKYQKELMAIFNQIINNEDEWDTDAVINAQVLHRHLRDFEFNFNLHLFSAIFKPADVLFEILLKETFNISFCINEIKKFVKILDGKKDDFDLLWNKVITKKFNRKRNRGECVNDMKMTYKVKYSEILDTLSANTTNRFRDMKNLKFMELFTVGKFKEYEAKFPDSPFESLQVSYAKHFDFLRLKSELIYMYSTPDFHLKSINSITELIAKDDLKDIFAEVFNLIQLICTIPATSASIEPSFSTMERVKTFTRNNQSEDIKSDIILISIEKTLMLNLKSNKKIYDAVIDEFCKKEKGIKLNFIK